MTCKTRIHAGLEIERCLEDGKLVYTASRGRHGQVAQAELVAQGKDLVVSFISVANSERRSGVGTRLYEAIAQDACAAGARLRSDDTRSEFAEAFWRKQAAKGRALCKPGRGEYFDTPMKLLRRKLREGAMSQADFDAATSNLPRPSEAGGIPHWPCETYAIDRPCAHAKLDGLRRRRKR